MSVTRKDDYTPSVVRNDNTPQKKPFHPLDMIRYFILVTDLALAAALWYFREDLLGVSDMTNIMAAIIAAGLIMGGLTAFYILKLASMKR